MKSLVIAFIATLALLTIASKAHAIELLSYKNTATKVTKYTEASVNEAWSKGPVCIKDGSKILGVNQAFKAKNLGYRDCSVSDTAKEKHRLLGVEVAVIKLTELPDTMAKKILGVK